MTEPVSLADAKSHLRLSDDDPYISSLSTYISAARQAVERYINGTIVNRARALVLNGFPVAGIDLPYGPVVSMTNITYVDTDGATQTITAGNVLLANYKYRSVVSPLYGESWPVARAQHASVTVNYTAGMMSGSPATLAEDDLWCGILLTLGDLWENREGAIVGASYTVNPTVRNLLAPYRRGLSV